MSRKVQSYKIAMACLGMLMWAGDRVAMGQDAPKPSGDLVQDVLKAVGRAAAQMPGPEGLPVQPAIHEHPPGHPPGSGDQIVTCHSKSYRYTSCPTGVYGGSDVEVYLVRQHSRSPCIHGQTWGYDLYSIWVDQGCQADFRVISSGPVRVACHSKSYRYTSCGTGRQIDHVILESQHSKTRCVQGQNWGYDRTNIWVDAGCQATFLVFGRRYY